MISIYKSSEYFLNKSTFIIESSLQKKVSEIIHQVIKEGDIALKDLTLEFDQVALSSIRVSKDIIENAGSQLDINIRSIFQEAIQNIKHFHQKQIQVSWQEEDSDGTLLGQIIRPLDRVGIYIPGGKAVYPSTLFMNAIPAQLAGVSSIVVVSPPQKDGLPHPLILAGCSLLGISEIYSIGGVQSIAALAYGTESIEPVYKITGPGNQWVTEAKRQVFGKVGIDSIAGPSDICILHDDLEIPVEYLVRDVLSQAEHDVNATSILLTTSQKIAERVSKRIEELVPTLPRKEIIEPALKNKGAIVIIENIEEGVRLVNQIAPEHLEIFVPQELEEKTLQNIRNAGAIFLGKWSSEPIGDYFAGPNHTIPTSGAAKYASPLSVHDFQKQSSLLKYSKKRFQKDAKSIITFAKLEELEAHAKAIECRQSDLEN